MMPQQPKSFFFAPENETEAKKIIANYPSGREASALVPLLDLAQRQHGGWLPRAAIIYVAGFLGVPEIKAFEVASFYTMFNLEPVGKYLIQLCRTTPCWLKGGEDVARACEVRLGIKAGETTPDGLFTIKEVECLGACVNAPVMQINDDYYEDLTPDKAVAVIDSLVRGERPKITARSGVRCSCSSGEGKDDAC